jgi:cytochrome P450
MPDTGTAPSSDLDPFSESSLLDPYPGYAELRSAGPAVWLSRYSAWAVSRFDDVQTVLGDWDRFTSVPNPGLEPDQPYMPKGGILGSDPPDHTRLREVIAEQMSPRSLRGMRGSIEEQADKHVADLVARGSFDGVGDLAQPFPIRVVADLIGLPREGRENLLGLADGAFNSFGPANERTLAGLPHAAAVFGEYVPTAMSRASIAPDSWGAAVYAAVDAGRIDEEEAVHLLAGFVVAGMDTTIHAIGSALWVLATHKDVWQALREDLSLARPVFEETLRYESPVAFFARGATRDTDLGGVPIAAGDRVVTLLGAANRDDRHFDQPDTFDVGRSPNDHMAFGYGIHSCGGQGLARIEGPAILASLAKRVERIELTGEPIRHLNNTVRGLGHLPLAVTPATT